MIAHCSRVFLSALLIAVPFFSLQGRNSYGATSEHPSSPLKRPKLVLVLVIDQFRADYLMRFNEKFLPAKKGTQVGGFQYLMSQSAYFPYAQYEILQSITAPGHATIATGSYPYLSGIVGNEWFNKKTQRSEYCVEDSASPLVRDQATGLNRNDSTGRSPKNLNGTTLSDELKNAIPQARVVSVALKDRAAILLGGRRADLALWFDAVSRSWASSEFYLREKKLPEWVEKLNETTALALQPKNGLPSSNLDTDPTYLEKGTDLTVDAAEMALKTLRLGKGPKTDYLAVSFSTHDILGHHVGPYDAAMESLTLKEDRSISRLLNTIHQTVGLKNVLIAFSADHGVAPSAEWATANKLDGARIGDKELRDRVSKRLEEKFGKATNGQWISGSFVFNFYLNTPAIQEKSLDQKKVEEEAKKALLAEDGIQFAFTGSDYNEKRLPPAMLARQIELTYYPTRSGDIVAIPKPFYISARSDAPPGTSSHMTGFSYDKTVPLMISGNYVKSGIYASAAKVVDIAPTLSFLLGVLPPALSEGRILSEILRLP